MYLVVAISCVIIFVLGLKLCPHKANTTELSRVSGFIAMFGIFSLLSGTMIWRSTGDSHASWWVYIVASIIGSVVGILMELFSDPVPGRD